MQAFTAWLNGYLARRDLKINNLQTDLQDGTFLNHFLEIVDSAKVPFSPSCNDSQFAPSSIEGALMLRLIWSYLLSSLYITVEAMDEQAQQQDHQAGEPKHRAGLHPEGHGDQARWHWR
jgi:hypothetical protein